MRNLVSKLRHRARLAARLGWRTATWPVRHRRLPSRHHVRMFLEQVGALLPARLRRIGLLPQPSSPVSIDPPVFGQRVNFGAPPAADPYGLWIEHNAFTPRSREAAEHALATCSRRPLLSVIMPVYNIDDCWLEKAVASVRAQVYSSWELCIADDASTAPNVRPLLARLAAADPRIRVQYLPKNGNISAACNAAAELAQGEFLVFLDQDDELTPDCLLELALAIDRHPDSDVLYSDDDKIDVEGRRFEPQFKPDWSPELLLSYMYFSHVFCVRRELYRQVGGCRLGFEGTQDYDLALRVTEQARRVTHIPRVLYHWRCLPSSTAASGAAKPAAFDRGLRAVQEALERRSLRGSVSRPDWAVRLHMGIFQIDFPDSGPQVTIVIPTRNRLDLLRKCVQSILTRTAYENYEVLIIDNDSDDRATLAYLASLPSPCRVVRLSCPGDKFSYAWLNNEAVKHADNEYVLFLNNDTEVRRPEWLSQLVGYAQMSGVGPVGARLVFPDRRVQHAGVITGPYGGMAAPAFKLLSEGDGGYLCYALTARNYSAVTAACLLIRRNLFLEVGGFDEARFAVAYNDVDLCLRLRQAGWRSVFAPRAELTHHEGASRGFGDNPSEILAYRRSWGRDRDPYFNPNLSLEHERFGLSTRRATVRVAPSQLPVKALMCAHNLNLEGAPLSQFEMARGLKQRGRIAPEVCSPQDGPLARLYREAGIPVHVIPHPFKDLPYPGMPLNEIVGSFSQWIGEQDFEVVYANTLLTYWAVSAAHLLGLPSLWNVRESVDWRTYFEQFGRDQVGPALETFTFPYRVIFVAEATRALFQELNSQHNFSVIHNGLKRTALDHFLQKQTKQGARRRLGCPRDKTVITIIGTVCERKGQHDFARAARELLRRGRRDVFFYIVGCRPSPYQDALEELIRPHGEYIALVPETDDVLNYLRASDVFVCCSVNESYPRVLLEAMAFGLPIVTTSVFGIVEQVTHEVSALTYTPGDVQTLTHHLQRLASEPADRMRLAEGASAALDTLTSYDEMLEEYERLFLEAFLTGPTSISDERFAALPKLTQAA